jgi:hypothetical protein
MDGRLSFRILRTHLKIGLFVMVAPHKHTMILICTSRTTVDVLLCVVPKEVHVNQPY